MGSRSLGSSIRLRKKSQSAQSGEHRVIKEGPFRHSGESRNPGRNWMPDQVRHDKIATINVAIYISQKFIETMVFETINFDQFAEAGARSLKCPCSLISRKISPTDFRFSMSLSFN